MSCGARRYETTSDPAEDHQEPPRSIAPKAPPFSSMFAAMNLAQLVASQRLLTAHPLCVYSECSCQERKAIVRRYHPETTTVSYGT